jgi:hypothetical protein
MDAEENRDPFRDRLRASSGNKVSVGSICRIFPKDSFQVNGSS